MHFIIPILTITFNHTVAVVAHVAKELENAENKETHILFGEAKRYRFFLDT